MVRIGTLCSALVAAALLAGCSLLTPGPVSPRGTASPSESAVVPGPTPTPSQIAVTPVPTATATTPPPPAMKVYQGGEQAAFASPSGSIVCLMLAGQRLRCDYLPGDSQWKVTAPGCQFDSGRSLQLSDVASGACISDSIADTPVPESMQTSWWHPGDLMATLPGGSVKVAALPYGTALQVTGFRCESVETGVTCRNTGTGHGFVISRESYRIF